MSSFSSEPPLLPINVQQYLLRTIKENTRYDGRTLLEYRKVCKT